MLIAPQPNVCNASDVQLDRFNAQIVCQEYKVRLGDDHLTVDLVIDGQMTAGKRVQNLIVKRKMWTLNER